MISLRLTRKLERRISEAAEAEGISRSELVRKSIREYLSKRDKQMAWELGKDLFGRYDLENTDLSRDRKRIIRQRIKKKTNRHSR